MKRVYDKVKRYPESKNAMNYVSELLNRNINGPASLEDLQTVRVIINDTVNWAKKGDLPVQDKALVELRNIIDEAMESEFNLLEKVSKGSDLEKLKKLRSDYTKTTKIYENTLQREARELTKAPSIGSSAATGALIFGATGQTPTSALVGGALGVGLGLANKGYQSGVLQTTLGNALYNASSGGRLGQIVPNITSRTASEPVQTEMSAMQRYRLEKQQNQGR
jgi:hypothetical protein